MAQATITNTTRNFILINCGFLLWVFERLKYLRATDNFSNIRISIYKEFSTFFVMSEWIMAINFVF